MDLLTTLSTEIRPVYSLQIHRVKLPAHSEANNRLIQFTLLGE